MGREKSTRHVCSSHVFCTYQHMGTEPAPSCFSTGRRVRGGRGGRRGEARPHKNSLYRPCNSACARCMPAAGNGQTKLHGRDIGCGTRKARNMHHYDPAGADFGQIRGGGLSLCFYCPFPLFTSLAFDHPKSSDCPTGAPCHKEINTSFRVLFGVCRK